jgi:hypothetical protein
MAKIFGLTVFLFGFLAVYATYNDILPFWLENKPEEIRALWMQDIQVLVSNDKLPKEWTQVKEVKYQPLTATVEKLLKDIKPPIIPSNKKGNYRLEVTVDDWKENNEYGLMIQYQLIDLKSQNLIWELGRTLLVNSQASSAPLPSQSKSK